MTHDPTAEQSEILDFATTYANNLMITAYAGCGKTAILEMIASRSTVATLLVCFNKSVADEAIRRLPSTQVLTFNSLGHRTWGTVCSKSISLSKTKILDIYRALADEIPRYELKEFWSHYDAVTDAVNLARALGYIPPAHSKAEKSLLNKTEFHSRLDERPSEEVAGIIDTILLESIRLSYNGVIDFSDQCYMPALFGGIYPKFPLVLIDEYQDLSSVNHAIVAKLCKSSRQIGVGDEAQSIYGFRGANTTGMRTAVNMFAMQSLPLTISFRCPRRIAENVRWRVPEFKASREGGSVTHYGAISDNSAVICRNNAPLLRSAFACLTNGQSVSVAGTDIGHRLVKRLTKLGPETLSAAQAGSAIDHWLADQIDRGSASAPDMAACMRIFVKKSKTLGQAIGMAKATFASAGTIKFWTGHKAKGAEFDRVYHLDSHLLRDDQQDQNLRYVIDTRSRDELIYIDSE